jgi:hypothetical protein
LAQEKANALQPRLSLLSINVSEAVAATPNLEILRDGEVLGAATWNVPIPIDGGDHVIEARAPGKIAFQQSVTVAAENAAANIDIPPLEDAPPEPVDAAPVEPVAAAPTTPVDQGAAPRSGFSTLQWVGIGTAGLGVVSLGVGGVFLSTLMDEQEASEADCDDNVCGDEGFAARNRARDAGDTASILGVAGVVLIGAGATLYFVGDESGSEVGLSRPRVTVGGGPSGAWARVATSF